MKQLLKALAKLFGPRPASRPGPPCRVRISARKRLLRIVCYRPATRHAHVYDFDLSERTTYRQLYRRGPGKRYLLCDWN